MKNIILQLLPIIILFTTYSKVAKAQTITPAIINTAGGSGTVGANTIAYTIGEMTVTQTQTTGSLTVTHGVLQTNIKVIPEGFADIVASQNFFQVYPNPTENFLNIRSLQNQLALKGIIVFDMTGKIIQQQVLTNNNKSVYIISMQNYAAGNYLLQITAEHNQQIINSNYTITKK